MSAHHELTAMRRAIALGKIRAFSDETVRLAELVDAATLDRGVAIDALWDAADANGLLDIYGLSFVQMLLADAFGYQHPASLMNLQVA